MSKSTKKEQIAFSKATPQLIAQVETVLAEAKRHTYSVSRVFAAFNAVFNLNETPQTCASCLRSRAERLESWYVKGTTGKAPVIETPAVTVDAEGNLSGELDFPITYIIVDDAQHIAVEDDGVTVARVIFTPEHEGALIGTATDSQGGPAPDADYVQGEVVYLVEGGAGAYMVVSGEADDDIAGAALIAFYEAHTAKLADLGITEASSKSELLEALQLLATDENATGEELEHYARRIEAVQELIDQESGDGITVLTLKDEGAQPVHFTTEDKSAAVVGSKGLVKHADGTNVKTGTHDLADGNKLAVAVGGRATIK